jgi:valyl-tRNA synthetase
MSKSKGAMTAQPMVDEWGADGVRYWACRGGPGTDTAADPGVMKVGRRLAI